MKIIRFTFLLGAFLLLISPSFISGDLQSKQTEINLRNPLLVSTRWLADHLNDPNIIILHISQIKSYYEMGHIPCARFLWPGWLAQSTPDLSIELPPVKEMTRTLQDLGISNDSFIVLCSFGGNTAQTARMFATLEWAGLTNRVSILDGGLETWKAEGKPISTETPEYQKGKFSPVINNDIFVDAEWIKRNIENVNNALVDARTSQYYSGETGFPRKGHIPGARNVNAAQFLDTDGKLLSDDKLKEIFLGAGINPGSAITAYCHVGQSASIIYFVARYLGYKVNIYDGSFEEWSIRENLPVELPPAKETPLDQKK